MGCCPLSDRNWKQKGWIRRHRYFDKAGIFIADGSYIFVPDKEDYQSSVMMLFDEHNHPISKVKTEYGIDVTIGVKRNMNVFEDALGLINFPEVQWESYTLQPRELPDLNDVVRAKRPARLPTVLSVDETAALLTGLFKRTHAPPH